MLLRPSLCVFSPAPATLPETSTFIVEQMAINRNAYLFPLDARLQGVGHRHKREPER